MLDQRVGRAALLAAFALAGGVPVVAQESEAERHEAQVEARRQFERDRDRASRMRVNGRGFIRDTNRGRLGVSISSSTDDQGYAGALISDVTPEGPAARAGIRDGDFITAINGHSLVEPLPDRADERDLDLDGAVPVQRLMALMRDVEPGDEVEVTYERDGAETTTTVVADAMEGRMVFRGGDGRGWSTVDGDWEWDFDDMADVRVAIAPRLDRVREWAGAWGFSGFGSSGLELAALNPELGSYFGAESGVLVLDIDEDTTLGLEPGDVLLDIDGREVRDRDHARRILGSYDPGEAVIFGVIRRGARMTVEGELPDRRRHRGNRLRN